MLTDLEPEYKFTDGKAIVTGEYLSVAEGNMINVYIPSLMTEIECTPAKETVYCMETTGNTLFLNENHPNFPDVVTATTCMPVKVSGDLVLKSSNAELQNSNGNNGRPIRYIPKTAKLSPGTEVLVESDMGTFKDLRLY